VSDFYLKEYGNYEVPETILRLFQLENELSSEGLTLGLIGLRITDDHFFYHITPPDLIPFATTCGDGIHFGFLTDFGEVKDLEKAPIICVSPTNDPPIRYVARSIQEFLRMVITLPDAEDLESNWPWKEEVKIEELYVMHAEFADEKWLRNMTIVRERLKEHFQLTEIDVGKTIREALKERASTIIMETHDGLGVMGEGSTQKRRFSFEPERSESDEELQRMAEFLKGADEIEKLAFIRDAFYWYVLTPDIHLKTLNVAMRAMKTLGKNRGYERTMSRMDIVKSWV